MIILECFAVLVTLFAPMAAGFWRHRFSRSWMIVAVILLNPISYVVALDDDSPHIVGYLCAFIFSYLFFQFGRFVRILVSEGFHDWFVGKRPEQLTMIAVLLVGFGAWILEPSTRTRKRAPSAVSRDSRAEMKVIQEKISFEKIRRSAPHAR